MQNKIIHYPVKDKDDMILEVKGIITLIYDGVMRLEEAYRSGNWKEKRIQLKLFRCRRDFFYGQVESNNFSTCEKLKIYHEMQRACLLILKHETDLYHLNRTIVKATNHYLVRIMQRVGQLEDLIKEENEIRRAINLKKDGLAWLEAMRHKGELFLEGVKVSMLYHVEQIEKLEKRLLELND